MSQRSSDTIWHDEVTVGKSRWIAARGLTPNHLTGNVRVRVGYVNGILVDFRHNDGRTAITAFTNDGQLIGIVVPYLEEIEVTVE
jgi:hypothetical protein